MPWITVDGIAVHVKVAKPRRQRCAVTEGDWGDRCSGTAEFQCDWKITDRKTCSAHLCRKHAHQVAHDTHLCPCHHQRRLNQVQRNLFTGLGL